MGVHFFNPVAMMPLVEVVQGEATGAEVLRRLREQAPPRAAIALSANAMPSSGATSFSRAVAAAITSGERSSIAMLVMPSHPFSRR